MKLVKINNLIKNGVADYQGLDLNKIVGGTQLYPDYENVAYFQYNGDVTESANLQVVTLATYTEHKNRIESAPQPITQEQQINELKTKNELLKNRQDATEPYVERVKTATEIYEENKDKTGLLIEDIKQLRINKLKEECSNAIYDGFEFNGAHFGFNVHDQSNFTQQLLLIVAGNTAPIQWKTKNVGVVNLTAQEFQAVIGEATNHKMTEQAKYWTIEQLIIASQAKEEITAIEW